MQATRGAFGQVGPHLCVVTALFGDDPDVPEDHVGVWYGEVDENGAPKVRTVPECYVKLCEAPPVYYH
jgi:hypothetical protein